MIHALLDSDTSVVLLESDDGHLTENDLNKINAVLNPFIEDRHVVQGILLKVRRIPDRENFAKMLQQLVLAKNHERCIPKVAIATDSDVAELFEPLCNHFIAAEVRHFAFSQASLARVWAGQVNSRPTGLEGALRNSVGYTACALRTSQRA